MCFGTWSLYARGPEMLLPHFEQLQLVRRAGEPLSVLESSLEGLCQSVSDEHDSSGLSFGDSSCRKMYI